MPPSAELESIKARYPQVPRVHTATTAGQVVDLITRHRLFEAGPKKTYAVVMREVLDGDIELKEAYNR